MEINKETALAVACIFLCSYLFGTERTERTEKIKECYGESSKYTEIDTIPPQQVNNEFTVRVYMSEHVKNLFPNKEAAISLQLHANKKDFYIYDPPSSPIQLISNQGGQWEWGVQALEPGQHFLSLRVGLLKNGPQNSLILEENCRIPIDVQVEGLKWYTSFWQWIWNNLGLLISNSVAIILAIIGWARKAPVKKEK